MPVLKIGADPVFDANTTRTKTYNYWEIAEQASNPSAPVQGEARLYGKTDKKVYIRTAGGDYHDLTMAQKGCKVTKSGAQTITGTTATVILWDTESFDTDAFHSTGSNTGRFTAQNTSRYQLKGNIAWLSWTVATTLRIRILKNGTAFKTLFYDSIAITANPISIPISLYADLIKNDYLEIEVTRGSGTGSDDVTTASNVAFEQIAPEHRVELYQESKGHDITLLSNVISDFRCLRSDLGGTTLTDVNGNHTGTILSTWNCPGRPWVNTEGQAWLNTKVTLANTANLITEARDASCAVMFVVDWQYPDTNVTGNITNFFIVSGSTTSATAANNCLFAVRADNNNSGILQAFWESGAGVSQLNYLTRLAPGRRHICVAREHETGVGTSTLHSWVDGIFIGSTSGIPNPATGTSAIGYMMVDNAATPGDTVYGCSMTDIVWISGSIPTTSQVLVQAKRTLGIYP